MNKMDIFLTNSLSRKKEEFRAINPPGVGLYTCGMTVYDYAHIGHGRKYVMDDILRRVLTFNGYKVKHVQNVTDVGHLVSDGDEGEDKMEKGVEKSGKTVWEIADFYTDHFYRSMDRLNILRPDVVCRATGHIPEQISLIEKLFKNGYAYDTPEAVYFDTASFKNYGELFGQKLEDKKTAVRVDIKTGEYKKHPADFALWFKRVGRFENHTMHWKSPWGDGFPGWHLECSAMSMKYLGEQFDVHTGGEDHLSIHHPNEIAQSEGATGKKPFVKYWVHYAFLLVDGRKMSKSLKNFFTIEDVEKKGYSPAALRYLYLTAHYRDPLNFTWEALSAAQSGLKNLRSKLLSFREEKERTTLSPEKEEKIDDFRKNFFMAINDDLNTPRALAVLWEMLKSSIPSRDKYDLAISFDEVLGLELSKSERADQKIPEDVQELLAERERLRKDGRFAEADELRKKIEKAGFSFKDEKVS